MASCRPAKAIYQSSSPIKSDLKSMKLAELCFAFTLPFLLLLNISGQTTDNYVPGPDSKLQPGVPKGELLKLSFNKSKVFPGTVRDYWIYVPAQYKPDKPACVMVFQDGAGVVKEDGDWRIPIIFDNL